MIYLTGDTHGNFTRIDNLCRKMHTTKDDIMVIMGDAGINFRGSLYDVHVKKALQKLPITLFCIHGNHEMRPSAIDTYKEITWNGGIVYREDKYPDLIFAKDGEIYNLEGTSVIVLGGAYSVDKFYRLERGIPWWADEQPSDEIKAYAEKRLEETGWCVDAVFSHTVPLKYMPTEHFLKSIDQSKVDKSTEEWLDKIEEKLTYRRWYAGHYHCEKSIDKLRILFNDIVEYDAYDEAVRQVRATLALEGLSLTPSGLSDLQEMAEGKISREEVQKRLKSRYMAKEPL